METESRKNNIREKGKIGTRKEKKGAEVKGKEKEREERTRERKRKRESGRDKEVF